MSMILIGGGARSGKSHYALELARRHPRRVFVATARAVDEDMEKRIARHRAERPDFRTIEEPIDLARAIRTLRDTDVVVIDCLTFFISNLMLSGLDDSSVLMRVDELLGAIAEAQFEVIIVSNEVGMSVHPPTELGRRFQDCCGWVHQRIAPRADALYLAMMGTILRLRPAPVEVTR